MNQMDMYSDMNARLRYTAHQGVLESGFGQSLRNEFLTKFPNNTCAWIIFDELKRFKETMD